MTETDDADAKGRPAAVGSTANERDCWNEAIRFEGYHEAIMWNPGNKVVQDHRDGTVYHDLTNSERAARGLPTPWTPEMALTEVHEAGRP